MKPSTDVKTLIEEIKYNAEAAVPGTETLTFYADPFTWKELVHLASLGIAYDKDSTYETYDRRTYKD